MLCIIFLSDHRFDNSVSSIKQPYTHYYTNSAINQSTPEHIQNWNLFGFQGIPKKSDVGVPYQIVKHIEYRFLITINTEFRKITNYAGYYEYNHIYRYIIKYSVPLPSMITINSLMHFEIVEWIC